MKFITVDEIPFEEFDTPVKIEKNGEFTLAYDL